MLQRYNDFLKLPCFWTKKEKAAGLSSNGLQILSICSFCELLSNCNSVSSNSVSSNAVSENAINNLLDSVGFNLSGLSLLATRSERDSCNSYEHKY